MRTSALGWGRARGGQQAPQRLRNRNKTILRNRIAATLDDPVWAAVNDEIGDLFTALAN
jgi:hypothetical protein